MGKPRRTKDGVPIRFVFLDESGHPFYDEDGPGQFVMSAVIVDDPSDAFTIIDGDMGKEKGRTYTGEHKHSHASNTRNERIVDDMGEDGMMTIVTSEPIRNIVDHSVENGPLMYRGVLSRMLANVAKYGKPGIYRIRLDDSEYIDEPDLLLLSQAAFAGYDDKELAKHAPVRLYDSEFCVPIQLADTTVGEYIVSYLIFFNN